MREFVTGRERLGGSHYVPSRAMRGGPTASMDATPTRMVLIVALLFASSPAIAAGITSSATATSAQQHTGRQIIFRYARTFRDGFARSDARAEKDFLATLNEALAGQARFPIEIHAAPDPEWTSYQRFRKGVVA